MIHESHQKKRTFQWKKFDIQMLAAMVVECPWRASNAGLPTSKISTDCRGVLAFKPVCICRGALLFIQAVGWPGSRPTTRWLPACRPWIFDKNLSPFPNVHCTSTSIRLMLFDCVFRLWPRIDLGIGILKTNKVFEFKYDGFFDCVHEKLAEFAREISKACY